ncbi:MAG: AAA family ATPase [Campylobacter sp.]|nr:AAA family ATPase [Campylobacter sp.]MBR0071090.1 AAA family ATPase [Campylobacter sp.]
MVEYLKIKNFKGIKELEIKDLSPVNIFVGKANTGKTSVLEALSFLYETLTNRTIANCLEVRGLRANFYDRNLSLRTQRNFEKDAFESLFYDINIDNHIDIATNLRSLKLQFSKKTITRLDDKIEERQSLNLNYKPNTISDSVNLVYSNHKAELLNNIYSEIADDNRKKEKFVDYLKKFDKDFYECELKNNSLYIRMKSLSKAINIKQMGQGVIFYATICALLVRGDKTIIIDEIENGLHYSALDMVLNIIFDKAKNENIQFFISTHSLEFLRKANIMLDSGKFGENLVSVFNIFKQKDGATDYIEYSQEKFIRQLDLDNEIRGF